ncbi:MAG: hypothetical protein ACOYJ1_17155, partial [Peptococcales bacterium]
MRRNKRILTFLCLYFSLAGFLIWGTVFDDKFVLKTYNPKPSENIYQKEIGDALLTVKEIQNGVYQIKLKSQEIIYDAVKNPQLNIGVLNYLDKTLFIHYGLVRNPDVVEGRLKKLGSFLSQDVPVNNYFYLFILEGDIGGSYRLDFYSKNNKKVESLGPFTIGTMNKIKSEKKFSKDDAIAIFNLQKKLNGKDLDNY